MRFRESPASYMLFRILLHTVLAAAALLPRPHLIERERHSAA